MSGHVPASSVGSRHEKIKKSPLRKIEAAMWGKVGDLIVFPPNLVGKRYADGTTDFFVPVVAMIEDRVRQGERQG